MTKNYVFPSEGKKHWVCLPSDTSGGKHWRPFTAPVPMCLPGMERQGTSCQPGQLPQGAQPIQGGRLRSEPGRTAGIHLCCTSRPLSANSFCRSLRCRSGTGREASLSAAWGSLLQHCSTPGAVFSPLDPSWSAASGGIVTLTWPKLIQTHSVAFIILVDYFYRDVVNAVTSEMGSGEGKGLYPEFLRTSSGREIARHSRWTIGHDNCSASD